MLELHQKGEFGSNPKKKINNLNEKKLHMEYITIILLYTSRFSLVSPVYNAKEALKPGTLVYDPSVFQHNDQRPKAS